MKRTFLVVSSLAIASSSEVTDHQETFGSLTMKKLLDFSTFVETKMYGTDKYHVLGADLIYHGIYQDTGPIADNYRHHHRYLGSTGGGTEDSEPTIAKCTVGVKPIKEKCQCSSKFTCEKDEYCWSNGNCFQKPNICGTNMYCGPLVNNMYGGVFFSTDMKPACNTCGQVNLQACSEFKKLVQPGGCFENCAVGLTNIGYKAFVGTADDGRKPLCSTEEIHAIEIEVATSAAAKNNSVEPALSEANMNNMHYFAVTTTLIAFTFTIQM